LSRNGSLPTISRNTRRVSHIDDVEIATAEWVDWYNHRRPFEYCDDLTPVEAETAHYAHHEPQHQPELSNQ